MHAQQEALASVTHHMNFCPSVQHIWSRARASAIYMDWQSQLQRPATTPPAFEPTTPLRCVRAVAQLNYNLPGKKTTPVVHVHTQPPGARVGGPRFPAPSCMCSMPTGRPHPEEQHWTAAHRSCQSAHGPGSITSPTQCCGPSHPISAAAGKWQPPRRSTTPPSRCRHARPPARSSSSLLVELRVLPGAEAGAVDLGRLALWRLWQLQVLAVELVEGHL